MGDRSIAMQSLFNVALALSALLAVATATTCCTNVAQCYTSTYVASSAYSASVLSTAGCDNSTNSTACTCSVAATISQGISTTISSTDWTTYTTDFNNAWGTLLSIYSSGAYSNGCGVTSTFASRRNNFVNFAATVTQAVQATTEAQAATLATNDAATMGTQFNGAVAALSSATAAAAANVATTTAVTKAFAATTTTTASTTGSYDDGLSTGVIVGIVASVVIVVVITLFVLQHMRDTAVAEALK